MFEYVDYDTSMEHGKRWYKTPIGALPSITSMLGATESEEKKASLKNWQTSLGATKAKQVVQDSCDHGTAVHLMIERFLLGQDPYSGMLDREKNAFNAIKLKLKNINSVWGLEKSVYSPSLQIAGRFDCVGVYKDFPAIIDFKTSINRVKSKKDILDYEFQLAFYALAHNELFGTEIKKGVIIMAAQTGFPLEFIVDLESRTEELRSRVKTFWEKLLLSF